MRGIVMSRKSKALQFVNEGYNINVTGRHVQVTDAMKDYAMEKVSKIDRFSQRIIDVNITMDIQKLEHRVDIVLKVDHIKIKAQAITDNMYASIDKATDKISEQLRRYKNKIQEHHVKGVKDIDMNVNVLRSPTHDEEVNRDIEEENERRLYDNYRPHEIVDRETIPLKVLTYGEAIMKMELSGDVFLIFRSEEDRKLKVIYRRSDRNFGVIEVES